jgi:S1-C subfamily serine protease
MNNYSFSITLLISLFLTEFTNTLEAVKPEKKDVWTWNTPFNPSAEVVELEKLAQNGDSRAKAEMSLRHFSGAGVAFDLKKSLSYCENNSHPVAKFVLAALHKDGWNLGKDSKKSSLLYQEALGPLNELAASQDPLSMAVLSKYYTDGLASTVKDVDKAKKLSLSSHNANCWYGTLLLAHLLIDEGGESEKDGIRMMEDCREKNLAEAITWFVNREAKTWKDNAWEPTEEWLSGVNELASLGSEHALKTIYDVSMGLAPLKDKERYIDHTRSFGILSLINSPNASAESKRWIESQFVWHYLLGLGTPKDFSRGFEIAKKHAFLGNGSCMDALRFAYETGSGVPKNYVQAYTWKLLAESRGVRNESARPYEASDYVNLVERRFKELIKAAGGMDIVVRTGLVEVAQQKAQKDVETYYGPPLSQTQIAEGQQLAQAYTAEIERNKIREETTDSTDGSGHDASGTGFAISSDGFIATNYHVIQDAKELFIRTSAGNVKASLILADRVNDLAIIKAGIETNPLTLGDSSQAKAGNSVYTVGFPNPKVQGFESKLTKGDINSSTGISDDPRMFQVSVPIQPGNSGGPLLDEKNHVIGIITSQLNGLKTLADSGSLPQNVNYAVKVSYLKLLIESHKDIKASYPIAAENHNAITQNNVLSSVFLILVHK